MAIYTSRYSNPALRTGEYTTVRISAGHPKWNLGYRLDCEISGLIPFGLFNNPKLDRGSYRRLYLQRLDKNERYIFKALAELCRKGKDVVLLCYEDVRKPGNWCHRTAFAEWWKLMTGEVVEELHDPTPAPRLPQPTNNVTSRDEVQTSMFN